MLGLTLQGSFAFRQRTLYHLAASAAVVPIQRVLRGPKRPRWSLPFEMTTYYLRQQLRFAVDLPTIQESREFLDTVKIHAPVLQRTGIVQETDGAVRGRWFNSGDTRHTVLYLHGGGYAYYPRAYDHLIALVTEAAGLRTFALDYRLAPEHPFPAQLDDALAAYRWLLRRGLSPREIILAGDSAGGNLALCLLRAIRKASLPMPAAAICLSPWTDLGNGGESMTANEPFDILERRMTMRWTDWVTRGRDPRDPDISPLYADCAGFPPIYIQAGDADILFDMIHAYVKKGMEEGATITFDVWKDMTHGFQSFGKAMVHSREALNRISQYVEEVLAPQGLEDAR
jgi:monoterpene epsilon-lactone hydrolase